MNGYTNDNLTTLLRDAAARESITPRPATEVRRHAEQVRTRRRVAAVTLAAAVVVAGGVAVQQATSPSGLFTTPAPPATAPPSLAPAPTDVTTPTSAPSTSAAASPGTTDDGDADSVPRGTAAAWPAPPKDRSAGQWRPWTLPGYDYGSIVAARMEDGHAVITFDRKQLYTAEQWKAKTGEEEPMDFRVVNESTRTRQFVVEDDAPLYGNWLLTDQTDIRRYTPEQLVERINAVLVEQAVQRSQSPPVDGAEPPSVTVFLFHSERQDGPVAFLEEASMYTG